MSDAKKREQLYPSLAFFVASFIMIIAAVIWGINKRGFAVIFVIALLAMLCILMGIYLLRLYLQPLQTEFHSESVNKLQKLRHAKSRNQRCSQEKKFARVKSKPSNMELVDKEESDSLENSVQSYFPHSHSTQSKRSYGVSAHPIQRQAKVHVYHKEEWNPDWDEEDNLDWNYDDEDKLDLYQESNAQTSRPILEKPLQSRQQKQSHSQSGQLVRKESSTPSHSSHSSHSQSVSHTQLVRKNSSQIL